LTAGYRAACQEGFWVCDQFHEFQDLFHRCHQLQRQAYGAIGKEIEAAEKFANAKSAANLQQADGPIGKKIDAAEKFANAKSEANLQKRLKQYEQAQQVCEQAIARYDQ